MRKTAASFILLAFVTNSFVPPSCAVPAGGQARALLSELELPLPGIMVNVSNNFVPPMLKGIKVNPDQPFQLDFILDTGHAQFKDDGLKEEAQKLIRYFLASLAVPAQDLWVNLSPYEKDRIIPDTFSVTEMGRDLLAQDYILKQVTAALIYPEKESGKAFWKKVYAQAYRELGNIEIPVDTFNKVWIVPGKAVVYEKGAKAFVVEATLKVMLESDYLAMENNAAPARGAAAPFADPFHGWLPGDLALHVKATEGNGRMPSELAKDVLRSVIIPVLEKEVNEGRNFAPLRQVYQALILASWYKETLKDSILNRKYANQNKVLGLSLDDRNVTGAIYKMYLEAFQKGAFNYIKEEYDAHTDALIPRKYFSGGFDFAQRLKLEKVDDAHGVAAVGDFFDVLADLNRLSAGGGKKSFAERPVYVQPERSRVPVLNEGLKADKAVLPYGGIDLNTDRLGLQRTGAPAGIEWPTDAAQLNSMQIDGLVPVVIKVTPVRDILQAFTASS